MEIFKILPMCIKNLKTCLNQIAQFNKIKSTENKIDIFIDLVSFRETFSLRLERMNKNNLHRIMHRINKAVAIPFPGSEI